LQVVVVLYAKQAEALVDYVQLLQQLVEVAP
jgi:hypothetical protein